MFGVLIVDDEMIVRYGIKSMIAWDKLELTIVGDASNGAEAMEIFRAYSPEIVITDIKMPVMDGIELIKNIRELNAETKIIILSCLQDFACAKEAISLGASEYFVKSDMMPSDMEKILVKVKKSIVVEKTKQIQINDMRMKALKTQVIEKEQLLWDLSMDVIANNEATKSIITDLGLDYLSGDFFVLNASVDYYEKVTYGFSEQEKIKLCRTLSSIVTKTLETENYCKGEVYFGSNGDINFIIKLAEYYSELNTFEVINSVVGKIIKSIKVESGHSITVGISQPINNLSILNIGYSQAKLASKSKIFFGCGKVINYSKAFVNITPDKQVSLNFKQLRDYVYLMSREAINSLIDEKFNKIVEIRDYDGIHIFSLELVLTLNNIYAEVYKDDKDINNKKKEYYDQIKYLETIEDIKSWFKLAFGQLLNAVSIMYSSDKKVMSKTINYIESNYDQDISLQTISEHVHLSKNYFVNLFKKEMGESFVDYLTKVRIENAKKLLQNSQLKINDIGIRVGIEDSRYFSKVFKKSVGCTPKEYRLMALIKEL